MIECDVRETADGEYVVFHDPALATHGAPRIANLTLDEVRSACGASVAPTLREVLRALAGTPLDIEVKAAARPDRLLALLGEERPAPGSFISSFDLELLARLDAAARARAVNARAVDAHAVHGGAVDDAMPLVLVASLERDLPVRAILRNAAYCLAGVPLPRWLAGISVRAGLARRSLVRRVRRLGRRVYPWTVNDARAIERYIAYGVDGIITDVPSLARSIVGNPR